LDKKPEDAPEGAFYKKSDQIQIEKLAEFPAVGIHEKGPQFEVAPKERDLSREEAQKLFQENQERIHELYSWLIEEAPSEDKKLQRQLAARLAWHAVHDKTHRDLVLARMQDLLRRSVEREKNYIAKIERMKEKAMDMERWTRIEKRK